MARGVIWPLIRRIFATLLLVAFPTLSLCFFCGGEEPPSPSSSSTVSEDDGDVNIRQTVWQDLCQPRDESGSIARLTLSSNGPRKNKCSTSFGLPLLNG